jgi:hypothetical protein
MTTINLTKNVINGNYAIYLPAISGFYTTHLGKDLVDPTFIPKERVPNGFELGIQGVNFLDPINSYYHYGYGLFSAGHAERNLKKCNDRDPMIHKRDRKNTIIIGDSGGFQIATGVIKLDWANVKGSQGDALREEILRYLEHTADWSMTLDVPAFAAEAPLNKKTGLNKFEDALDVTIHNLDYFMKNRIPGKTKFLNVLSGSSDNNSKEWYDAVKHFSIPSSVEAMGYDINRTLEGWAFAGINMKHMPTVLNRLLDLIEDGLLKDKNWIHFLGIGRLDWACYLTSIKRQLQKHYNSNINISFDAASPFMAVGGYALVYSHNYFDPQRLTYRMNRGVDDKALKGSKLSMPFQGPIMERLTIGDICVYGPDDPNKNGKIGKTSWDTTSYLLGMAHSVYNHIQAVQEILRLADIEYTQINVDYRDCIRSTKTATSNKSDFVPNNILYFNKFIEILLDPTTDNPRGMIRDYATFLESISFGGVNDSSKSKEQFNDLFDINPTDKPEINIDDIANIQNEKTDKKLLELDKLND